MNEQAMSSAHQTSSPWTWPLETHEAATLTAAPVARWLRVDVGSVWVTAAATKGQAEDIWLAPGESLALPAGSTWVVEGWPKARLSLLEQAPRLSRAGLWRPAAWLRGLAA